MVWIYFTNCFSWHVNKAPTENREKHEMQHEKKGWKKYQAIQHRPYKVKHTSIQWIDCMVHLERVEKTQLKWKTISDTLILYHLCVSVFQEKHRLSNGTQYSFFWFILWATIHVLKGLLEMWRKNMYFKKTQ